MNFLEAVKTGDLLKRKDWQYFYEIDLLLLEQLRKEDFQANDWIVKKTKQYFNFQQAVETLMLGKKVSCEDTRRFFKVKNGAIIEYEPDGSDTDSCDNFTIEEIKSNKWYTV